MPGAYLNYMVFDLDMNYVGIAGFEQITSDANGAEELVQRTDIMIEQEGYLIAYLSNESNTSNYVYFDDFTVYHGKTNVVQSDDYYPFGLTFGSYTRTASTPQNFKYNGKEEIKELGVLDFGARLLDPALGRWGVIDALAYKYHSLSPYSYANNNPILIIDPDGNEIVVGANNSKTITNLAKIAATTQGARRVNALIASNHKYTIESVFWTKSSAYDGRGVNGRARTIYSVGTSYYPAGWATSSSILAHELNHAYEHNELGDLHYKGSKNSRERSSVKFGNYFRAVTGEGSMRTKSLAAGRGKFSSDPADHNPTNESVTDFTTEFESEGGGSKAMGFSYSKSENGEDSKKMYQIGMTNENGTYMFRIFDNKDDYDAAVKRVQEYHKKANEENDEE